uniref:Sema domain-containing protein n=1 Tax=Parastrongyloides trichosuri TaxID=131310 RepID=A0A0N5A3Z0_PARTI
MIYTKLYTLILFIYTIFSLNDANLSSRQSASLHLDSTINNIIIDKTNYNIYIGAVNELYKVTGSNLTLLQKSKTGPVLDSPLCNYDLSSCVDVNLVKQKTDNVNKLLQLTPSGQLLVCGSTRQGICNLYNSEDISLPIQNGTVPIASNSGNASTVGLIDEITGKLYVATSYSTDSPYRDNHPAIATREAPQYYPINYGSIEGEAAIQIRVEHRARFKVNYISSFKYDHYIFWGAVQNKNVHQKGGILNALVSNPLVTKLLRVCADDERYISYSELEIQCRGEDNTNYNILKSLYRLNDTLVGAFTDSSNRNAAICIFSMSRIQSTFWYNIDRCRDGIGKYGMPHIGRDYKCTKKPNLQLDQDTCFLGVGGSIETEQVASIVYNDRVITTLTGRNIAGNVIIVAGTEDGDILQFSLLLSSNSGTHLPRYSLQKYAEFTAASDSISNIEFLNDNEYLLGSGNQLSILRVSSCSYHDTCESCTQARDPLCGWCLLEAKCSQMSECRQTLANAFLSDICPKIDEGKYPVPMNISLDEAKKNNEESVFLPIQSLPPPQNFNYECFFGSLKSKGSTWSTEGITCLMPEKLPRIPNGSDNYETSLTLHTIFENEKKESLKRSKAIASFDFIFYTCKSNRMCSSCASSKWNCKWCSGNNLCLSINSNKTCNGGITDVDSCIKIDISNIHEILVADGSNHSVQFPVLNWNMEKNNEELYCRVLFENPIITKATIKGQYITCDSLEYNFENKEKVKKVGLELLRKNEIIDKTEVSMYKCGEMASDCSECLSLDPKYGCSWCKGSCKVATKCSALSGLRGSRFSDISPDVICTNPLITHFEPKSGPLQGGTTVTIIGTDLGTKIDDVRDRVYIGGSLCKVVGFEISKKIVCITEKGTGSGVVKITIGSSAKRIVESTEVFEYLDIQATSIYPTFGPISGGTQISIYGNNLNIGSNISVYLDNLPCIIDGNRNSSQIISCKTTKSSRVYSVSAIRIQIDNAVKIIDSQFEYREDPIITSIEPSSSFKSGGRLIAVYGSHFDSLLSAQIYLLNSNDATVAEIVSGLGVCKISNSTLMYCQSPKLMHHSIVRSKYPIGFFMDNVRKVRNLGSQLQMTITPDPTFDFFNEIKMQPTDQTVLILTGNHLSMSTTVDDYQVFIGTEPCNVVLLDYTQLLCRVPEIQPSGSDENGIPTFNNYPLVVVKVGNLRFEIGSIEYESTVGGNFGVMRMSVIRFILLLITVIFAIIIIIFCFITLWKRRNGERERDYKRIQQQMEQMESNVRNECKQAFAELQTDMTDLTLTIEDIGIPYQNMGDFLKVLLSHELSNDYSMYLGYNMVTSGVGSIYATQQQPMVITQFESLVFNRQFIFILIHMLESNPSITTNERSAVASAIMTCISRNMEYCTEVVFTLLEAHIESSVHNKTSHFLFRRSESVVEKLFSHWLSISIFPELANGQGNVAKSLYLLYRALKYQIEKGPIDAVTGDSRYSLSEQKLLREHVDAKANVLVIIPFESFDQFPIQLRVLQCDTITQVKSKLLDLLYKNQGFHNRLTVEQFDLVWQNNKKEIIILTDDDKPLEKGEKRLNTIGSYNIPSNATITMEYANTTMPIQANTFTYRSGSSDTTCSAWSSTHLLNNSSNCSASSPPPPVQIPGVMDKKYYHLNCGTSLKNGYCTMDGKKSKEYDLTYNRNCTKKKGKFIDKKHSNTLNISSNSSNIPEVFLTRLLTCKGSVQKFVEDFFENVLLIRKDCGGASITIKYVCDFFDYQAKRLNITDDQIIFTWKKNSIILRLMMNFINNPDFIFDVPSQNYLNSSLTVIGQTLMDCFSSNPHPFSKESPSSKLLFAKEINRYRPFAMELFTQISSLPPITDKVFYNHINMVSQTVNECLSKTHAINELLNWIKGNALPLVELLNRDEVSIKHRLGEKLQQIVLCTIQDSEHIYATLH